MLPGSPPYFRSVMKKLFILTGLAFLLSACGSDNLGGDPTNSYPDHGHYIDSFCSKDQSHIRVYIGTSGIAVIADPTCP